MRLAYFDCPSGISGDMMLGGIVDCGVAIDEITRGLASLQVPGFELHEKRVNKAGLYATQVEVLVKDEVKERKLGEILSLVRESRLPEHVISRALDVFQRIGTVEAGIHGLAVESIHLHELGGLDTIIDVVGVLLGMDILKIDRIYASPLPLGRGFIQSAHGTIPLPAPATLGLLEGVPITGSDFDKELVTPTGAALITSLVQEFGKLPSMRLLKTGYGAGKRDLPIPNIIRLIIGESMETSLHESPFHVEKLVCIECNIDNMNPEVYPYLTERLFHDGALDVSLTPISMKKNRPGTLVSVLCHEDTVEKMMNILFTETTTLGARRFMVDRYSIERHLRPIPTVYGEVNVKFSIKADQTWSFTPEYEDCRRLAIENQVSLLKVYRAAESAAQEHLKH